MRVAVNPSTVIHRQSRAKLRNLLAYAGFRLGVTQMIEHIAYERCRELRIALIEATRGECRRADADAARHEWRLWIVRHRVLVHGDMRAAERGVCVLARDAFVN